jgi:Family of unknown function (DUF6375)
MMKIWNSYGSEHSANLVMIGSFKDVASAEKAKEIIDEITKFMMNTDDDYRGVEHYSDAVMELLKRVRFYNVAPAELDQFRYDISSELNGNQIVVRTDETDISAFLKVMIDKGARVEVYSAHDYPDTGEEGASER